ncbi:MAG: metallo-mystery pair system four-Cys motif protein [Nannocystaceae bacterium]
MTRLGLALLLPCAAFAFTGCAGDDAASSDTAATETGTGTATETGTGGEGEPLTVTFAPVVGDAAFACGTAYDDLGTTAGSFQVNDFRLYIHDVQVIRGDGTRAPLTLADNDWQSQGVVLLDFENAEGECVGSPETNLQVVGSVADAADVSGVEFTIGVPEDLNHLDSASAPAPLNIPGMYWSWMGGYKYMRVDMTGLGGEPFVFHLGATGCTGSTADGFTCANNYRITLPFEGFDPATQALAVDLAALVATTDLTTPNDAMVDPVDGCMSGMEDPECPALFTALGLEHNSATTNPSGQSVFKVVDQ